MTSMAVMSLEHALSLCVLSFQLGELLVLLRLLQRLESSFFPLLLSPQLLLLLLPLDVLCFKATNDTLYPCCSLFSA